MWTTSAVPSGLVDRRTVPGVETPGYFREVPPGLTDRSNGPLPKIEMRPSVLLTDQITIDCICPDFELASDI